MGQAIQLKQLINNKEEYIYITYIQRIVIVY